MTNNPQSEQEESGGDAEPSLTSRVVKSVGWVFAGKAFGRGLKLIKYVVLARILAPEDFGLFGIVMLAIATLQTFSKTGFNAALIQRQDNTEDYLDTAWTIQAIRGLVLAGILFGIAPLVAGFFDEPRATALLRVMCISVALGGFKNIGIIYFRKELKFHKQVLFNTGAAAISLIVGVVLAYQLRSVWALIWARLVGSSTKVLLSYVLHPYKPSFELDLEKAAPLFNFGKFIFLQSIAIFVGTKGDDAFLGWYLGAGPLGLFQMAYRLAHASATQITHVIGNVTFPALSEIKGDLPRVFQALQKVLRANALAIFPVSAGIFLVCPEFVRLALGDKWVDIIPVVRILCAHGLLRGLGAVFGPAFRALGRPDLPLRVNIAGMAVMGLLIWPLAAIEGIAGVAVATTISMVVCFVMSSGYICSLLKCDIRGLLRLLIKPCLATVIMAGEVTLVKNLFGTSWMSFSAAVVSGAVTYAVVIMAISEFARKFGGDVYGLVRSTVSRS